MKYIIFLLFPIIGFSQDCEYAKNEIDEFTKKEIIMTPLSILSYGAGQHEVIRFQAVKIDGVKALKCYFVRQQYFSVNETSTFMLLDDQKETFTMNFPQYLSSEYDRTFNTYYIISIFFLTDDMIEDFQARSFTKLRYHTKKGYVEHAIKPKHIKNLQTALDCIK